MKNSFDSNSFIALALPTYLRYPALGTLLQYWEGAAKLTIWQVWGKYGLVWCFLTRYIWLNYRCLLVETLLKKNSLTFMIRPPDLDQYVQGGRVISY